MKNVNEKEKMQEFFDKRAGSVIYESKKLKE